MLESIGLDLEREARHHHMFPAGGKQEEMAFFFGAAGLEIGDRS
jgi:hypothetical protein